MCMQAGVPLVVYTVRTGHSVFHYGPAMAQRPAFSRIPPGSYKRVVTVFDLHTPPGWCQEIICGVNSYQLPTRA
jgi:hypothetical protein